MPTVSVVNRRIAKYMTSQPAVISITSPGGKLQFRGLHGEVLRLEFDDVCEQYGPEYTLFDRHHAMQILRFVERNVGKDIVVHCEYGVSRSPAVAKFIIEHYGYKKGHLNGFYPSRNEPNSWVFRKLEITYVDSVLMAAKQQLPDWSRK